MDQLNYTIEDSLELLVGLKKTVSFELEKSDITFLSSIARQTFKGVALTDRQCNVVKEKLLKYKDQFAKKEQYNIHVALDNLRMPLREIDRSKYVKIVDRSNERWIKVRFPFSKKLITEIDNISRNFRIDYIHDKGSHEHNFKLTERSVFEIVNRFLPKHFVIDQELLDLYEKILIMNNNKNKHIPGVYKFKLQNLSDRATKYMISSIGEPTIDNLALYKDRQDQFGLHYFDQDDLNNSLSNFTTLSKNIINRTSTNVFVNNTKYTLNNLAESLLELNRFPLLVVLPENTNPLDDLYDVHRALKGFIEDSESSVLFRLDNDNNAEFNNYIRKNNLNSPLDKTTKVVYISSNNITKPLLKSEWRASATLLMSSHRLLNKVKTYVDESDLVIHFDDSVSQYARFDKKGNGIQEV